jgi:hypothetical protein
MKIKIGNGSDWRFVNGPWHDDEDHALVLSSDHVWSSGQGIQGFHYAFSRSLCYRDVDVRFEIRLTGHSDAGILFRARDESHFYLLHFPNCAQASRAQHFWAAFSKMDDSGYLKRINMDLVRRVNSHSDVWLAIRASLKGDRLAVQIGEHGHFEAQDRTYASAGFLGLFNCVKADIRNLVVNGTPTSPIRWTHKPQPTNWSCPRLDVAHVWQQPIDLLRERKRSGRLILSFIAKDKSNNTSTYQLIRSGDNGLTWSEPEKLSLPKTNIVYPPRLHRTPSGRLLAMIKAPKGPGFKIAESTDEARTWSKPTPIQWGPLPKTTSELYLGPQAFLNLTNKMILLFAYGYNEMRDARYNIHSWGSHHYQAYVTRSIDDGRTWQPLLNIDTPDLHRSNLDLTEVCAVQTGDGRILSLTRPVYSPWMWEAWSHDHGQTWGPCVRGPFPGYATSNMLRTHSGAILVAHRLPSLTIHLSHDDGHTWDVGTTIDGSIWAMGGMIEVKPDVVLYVYWDSFESLMRSQYIRVTRKGLQPISPSDFKKLRS